MAPKLTAYAWAKLCNQGQQTEDLNPVVQVTGIRNARRQTPVIYSLTGESNDRYDIMLSDGSYIQLGMLDPRLNKLVRSQKLQKGSIVRLTGFLCRWFCDTVTLTINSLDVILGKGDIIGDPKPMMYGLFQDKKTYADYSDAAYHVQETPEHSCPFQIPTTKQKQSSESISINPNNKFVVAEEEDARISMMEKNKEDDCDVDACIEKLEKLGWRTQDSLLYDTALLMFGESSVYRKLWLHLLNPKSCEKWVRNAGSKYRLLG